MTVPVSRFDFLARLKRSVQLTADLGDTLRLLADELMRRLSADRVLIAVRQSDRARAFLWSVERAEMGGPALLERSELSSVDAGQYLFEAPPSWVAIRRPAPLDDVVILKGAGHTKDIEASADFIPEEFSARHLRGACLAVTFAVGSEWECRLFVLNANVPRPRAALRFVVRAAHELGPTVHNVYLFHQLRAQAVAEERAVLARALHDHLIQSLISAEMRIHAVRRHWSDAAAAELLNVERILHEEILGVRDLMQRIKPIHLQAEELLEYLDDHVQKFAVDTGIAAAFQSDVRHMALPEPMCTEVARLVREALSNVRKHSGARNIIVSLTENAARWCLVIEDDGRGLGAHVTPGSVPGSRARRLPSLATIKECVRSLRGELRLQSAAGGGLCLQISFVAPSAAVEGSAAQKSANDTAHPRVSPMMTALAATVDASRHPAGYGKEGRSHVQ
jgi:signal transduction histidine kinase